MAAARVGTSMDSEDVPQTAEAGRTHDCTDAFERTGGFPKGCSRAYALDFGRVSEPSGGLKI